MTDDILEELLRARQTRTPCALATVAATTGSVPRQTGSKMLVYADGKTSGTIGGGKFEALVVEDSLKSIAAKETLLSPSELRKFVGQYVPDYMVPSTFVQLAQLPLSSHGKLDRAALPEPSAANVVDEDSFETPQSQIEKSLAVFLTSLLGVTRVGKNDNFFELGGHSLMGAQLIAKISNTFGVELSLRSLFDHPTVGEVSAEIERLIHEKLASLSEDEAERMLESSQQGVQL